MVDKKCAEIESGNTFLLRVKRKKAAEMIENLINDGEELLSRYEEYEDSILLPINFYDCEPNGFPSRGIDIPKEINPIVLYRRIPEEKCIEARAYGIPRIAMYGIAPYYRVHISIDGLTEEEVELKARIEILRKLSTNSTVLFSVFDLNKYKIWRITCEQTLTTIGYGENWFIQAKGGGNIYATNPDKHFIDSFFCQINSLYTTLDMITGSSITRVKLIKNWLTFKKLVREHPKKILAWLLGIVFSTELALYLPPLLTESIKNFNKWLNSHISWH